MAASLLGMVCLILLLATRSRLDKAERNLREQELQLARLRAELADQARRLAQSEALLAQGVVGAPVLPGAAITSRDGSAPSAPLNAEGAHEELAPQRSGENAAAVSGNEAPGTLDPRATGAAASGTLSAAASDTLSTTASSSHRAAASGTHSAAASGTHSAAASDRDAQAPGALIGAEATGTQPAAAPPRDTAVAGVAAASMPRPLPAPAPPPSASPDYIALAFDAVRELIFGGNTVVRVGIVVLLVGITLLLRWATEHALFPIELRLAAVALGAVALVGFGFSKRNARRGFALTLQGGGIAALYLVVFFAFRRYNLVPAPLAFGLLCTIALSSGVLSVRQDSRALIFIAQLFGFAAPILASTGQGSHIALFSYYLLLNLLVFAVALYKVWRVLNLLGFVFTFGVATSWGVLRYEPSLFASTEPFLLAFFAVYVAIPVLFALRHPGTPHGWVDGSLVFGTPLATLGLQWALVHDRPFGMAYSVLVLAAVYLGLATLLRRYARERLRALTEAFLPIGVGFATLAIPYGIDDHNLTGAAWALEGAGLYWVGVRQKRWLSRLAGVGLQLLAGGARMFGHPDARAALPVLSSTFLASALIGVSALFVAQYAYRRRSELQDFEWRGVQLLIVWGIPFFVAAGLQEIEAWVPRDQQPGAELCWLALSALLLETCARKCEWLPARSPALLLWPMMAVYLAQYNFDLNDQPLSHLGYLGWPLMALAMLTVLKRFVDSHAQTYPKLMAAHATGLWLWAIWLMSLCRALTQPPLALDECFGVGAAALIVALLGVVVLEQSKGAGWPAGTHKQHYLRAGMTGLLSMGALWSAAANVGIGANVAPLPYLPVLNPIELPSLIGFVVAFSWRQRALRHSPPLFTQARAQRTLVVLCALLFCFWNALLARAVHHYAGVRFDPDILLDSSAMQLSITLSWTVIALGVMWFAHRRGVRPAWISAAVLLGVVVCKLFLHDLEQLSTPTKIASFMGVGALLLVIGYIAPVPPRAGEASKVQKTHA